MKENRKDFLPASGCLGESPSANGRVHGVNGRVHGANGRVHGVNGCAHSPRGPKQESVLREITP